MGQYLQKAKKIKSIQNWVLSPSIFQEQKLALTGVAQQVEHRPTNQKVAHSIPAQGTCLGCGPGPQLNK